MQAQQTSNTQEQITTVFVDDATTVKESFRSIRTTDDYDVSNQTLADFLAKPYLYSAATWSTTDAANTILQNMLSYIPLVGNAHYVDKLKGFAYMRGTLCVRVNLNCNPFQCGKLLLSLLPGDVSYGSATSTHEGLHMRTLTNKTMLPGITIDAGDSSVEFRIPYVSPSHYYDIATHQWHWGRIILTVLSPLNTGSGGETAADYNMYVWYENVELTAPVVPQSGAMASRRHTLPKKESKYELQAGVKSNKITRAQMKEQQSESGKPVSRFLTSVGEVANALTGVPFLSEIAQPVSWAARGLSGVASYFGWSKPLLNNVPMTVTLQPNRYSACVDGTDTAVTVANFHDNSTVTTSNMSIRDEDEMAMNFLVQQPALIDTLTWADTDAATTSLYSKPIFPDNMYVSGSETVGAHTGYYKVGPPIFYLNRIFSFWRGCIKIKIVVVKTEFHTGRLQVTFTPGFTTTTSPTLTTSDLAIREIIDLRSGSEFVLELPYMLPYNYTSTTNQSGVFDVQVLSELRHPETASSNVKILVYAYGGEDFEFNGLTPIQRTPVPYCLQSGKVVDGVIGAMKCAEPTIIPSMESMGEQISSVKQVLSRYTQLLRYATPTYSGYSLSVWPWLTTVFRLNSSTGALNSSSYYNVSSLIRNMYVHYKGSYKVGILGNAASFTNFTSTNMPSNRFTKNMVDSGTSVGLGAGVNWITSFGAFELGMGVAVPSIANNGSVFTHLPYYTPTKYSQQMNQLEEIFPDNSTQPISILNCSTDNTSLTSPGLIIAAGDDFQCGYYIGCPPITTSYA